jgi:hypothetical protein
VGVTTLKKACRSGGMLRWPFRKRRSIEGLIQKTRLHMAPADGGPPQAQMAAILSNLEFHQRNLQVCILFAAGWSSGLESPRIRCQLDPAHCGTSMGLELAYARSSAVCEICQMRFMSSRDSHCVGSKPDCIGPKLALHLFGRPPRPNSKSAGVLLKRGSCFVLTINA